MSKGKKVLTASAIVTTVAVLGVTVTPGVLGEFTASIMGEGNTSGVGAVAFSIQQTTLTEGGTDIISSPQAETMSTGVSDDSAAVYSFAANSLLPRRIEPDAANSLARTSTLKFSNKTSAAGTLTISTKTLQMTSHDFSTGVTTTSGITMPGDLISLKLTNNGADDTFGTADDTVIFDDTVSGLAALGAPGTDFVLPSGDIRYVTVETASLAQDLSAHMGQQIDKLDLKFSLSDEVLAAPGTPGTPTVVAGDGIATVTVVAPTTGGPPSSYTVTASPGGQTCTVTSLSTSCVMSGLTNGTAYTFTAVASNKAGTSSSSATSSSVTPVSATYGDMTFDMTSGVSAVQTAPILGVYQRYYSPFSAGFQDYIEVLVPTGSQGDAPRTALASTVAGDTATISVRGARWISGYQPAAANVTSGATNTYKFTVAGPAVMGMMSLVSQTTTGAGVQTSFSPSVTYRLWKIPVVAGSVKINDTAVTEKHAFNGTTNDAGTGGTTYDYLRLVLKH